jgi:ABC-2 type transport system ATP-binding protein
MNPVIRTDQLTRHFGSVHAVDGIGFEVPPGIVFGFLGPNGAGKTTTIRLLLGLLEPTAGRAEVFGLDTRAGGDQIREKCGALLEHTGLYERLTAEDNLEFYGRVWHMDAAQRRARAKELLESFGLYDRRRDNVGTWSRGMKQKLAVARTLFHRPQLVFLDEPTAGLDPVAAAALREDLHNLVSRQGVTVFLTTHNLSEAEKLCSQVAVVREGRLLAVGSPHSLRGQENNRVEVVGRNISVTALAALRALPEVTGAELRENTLDVNLRPGADSAQIIASLMQNGVLVDEVRKGRASLEEAFLDLVEEEEKNGH